MSKTYIALLRGINVGGNKKVPMGELKACFESIGHTKVKTYINSGNVIFASTQTSISALQKEVEQVIENIFGFHVGVLIIGADILNTVIKNKPEGFGEEPAKYHSDVVFLLLGNPQEVVKEFQPNPEVDAVWPGEEVIYHTRLSEKRTKSRLSKIIGKPVYKSMTIRNWNTVTKLAELAKS